jgi:GT2 family glycosyltransferase
MNVTAEQPISSADRAAPAALPPDLDLRLLGRRPARLSDATVRAVMGAPIPVAPQCRTAIPVRRDVPAGLSDDRIAASIVVVTFNNLPFTRMCIASLLANTDGLDYELFVVDNGSRDGTPDYLRAVASVNPHVRLILNDANRGFAPANNQALTPAQGNMLVLLNNDTIVPPGWLAGLVGRLIHPSVGAVGPVTNRIGNEAEIETEYTTYGEFLEFARRRREYHRHFDIPTPCMFCLALRRDAYERIGPLDERFEIGLLEDDDYAIRLRAAGYHLVCAEDVFVHHFGQASFGSLIPTGEFGRLLDANRRRFEEKWGRPCRPYARQRSPGHEELKQRIRRVVREYSPAGATILVVSKGDEELLDLSRADGRRAWHFPQAADGSYAGFYPADSRAAITHLEALRTHGAEYLLFPAPALWWLEHYAEFREWLDGRYRTLTADDCVLIDLTAAM